MIDSVVIQLENKDFSILEKHEFTGRRQRSLEGQYSSFSRDCQPFVDRRVKKGLYSPIVVWSQKISGKRGEKVYELSIQVSIPKMIYGINCVDFQLIHVGIFYKKLLDYLSEIGVKTTREAIETALLKRVDFAKVIILPELFGDARVVIKKLKSFDYKFRSDFNEREYHNGRKGCLIKFYCISQGFVVYEEMGSLLQQGKTALELKIADRVQQGLQKRNAIKFELSLQRQQTMSSVVSNITGIKKSKHNLQDVLNADISKKALLKTFDAVYSDTITSLISLAELEDNRLFSFLERSKLSLQKQEMLYYWVNMVARFGVAGTWEILKQKAKGGNLHKRKQDISLALVELGQISGYVPNLIGFLRNEIDKFEPVQQNTYLPTCKPLLNDVSSQNSITTI